LKKNNPNSADDAVQRILKTGIRGASPIDLMVIALLRDGASIESI